MLAARPDARTGDPTMRTGVRTVSVTAPARLHLGFLDMNGSRGRRFGSVGLTLEGLCVELSIRRAPSFAITGAQSERAEQFAKALRDRFNLPDDFQIILSRTIPEHAGLGSGTQLGVAVGVALARLFRLDLSVREIAVLVQRGQRSGIGAGAFEFGGFLVDGGKGASDDPPPSVSRVELPWDWRVLLVVEPAARRVHGARPVSRLWREKIARLNWREWRNHAGAPPGCCNSWSAAGATAGPRLKSLPWLVPPRTGFKR